MEETLKPEDKCILAVTGITGHSGRFFFHELEKKQFKGVVRVLVRERSNIEFLEKSVLKTEIIIGDYNDYESLKKLTDSADIVLHISNIYRSPDMLKACIENRVKRLVLIHTTGVYSKYKMASGDYKDIESKVERLIAAQYENDEKIDVTILRPTMIFGDMKDRNIHKFIEMVDKLPIMPEINNGRGKIRPVNARDLARAYYLVCMQKNLPKLYYDLSGEQSISLHQLFDDIGKGLGKKTIHLSCPMWFASFGARVIKLLSFGRVDFVEKVLRMGEDRDYGHDEATKDFGYTPEVFSVGLNREIKEYLSCKGALK